MTQLFRPHADRIFRSCLIAIVAVTAGGAGAAFLVARSDAAWNVGDPAEQPVPFRHDLHAGSLGVDCRFCHNTADRLAHAGMPTAQTCMICHSQIVVPARMFEPVRTSLAFGTPIIWRSVHRLPAYSYFHHGIHAKRGLDCDTCHGRVAEMRQTVKAETLSMGWCLDCHRNPSARTRATPMSETARHAFAGLTDCSTCHR